MTHTYYAELTSSRTRHLLRYQTYADLRHDLTLVTQLRAGGVRIRLARITRDAADTIYHQRWRSCDGIRPDHARFRYDAFWRAE